MDLDVTTLVRLSRRVATVFNGKNFPRSAQIEAMGKLQTFMKTLHLDEQQASANKVQEHPALTLEVPPAS